MNNKELVKELNELVIAIEDSLTVLAGTIARQTGPAMTLANLVTGENAAIAQHGKNAWRDRLLGSAKKIVAIQARPLAADDPDLQSLISSVLSGRTDADPQH